MGRPLGVVQSIGPPRARAAVTTQSPPPPAAALSVQHALCQGCTPLQARGWAGPTPQLRRQHCLKRSSSEPVLWKWHLLNSFYSAHFPNVKLHLPSAQQLGREFSWSLGGSAFQGKWGQEGFPGPGLSLCVCMIVCNVDRNPKQLAQCRHTAQYTVAILIPLSWIHTPRRSLQCVRGASVMRPRVEG